jgi:fermentation-respiration switch protein FrsA (DUF1100 family)
MAMPDGVNQQVDIATIGACLAVGLGIYALVVVGAYFTQASIIFRTGGLTATPPAAFPIEQVAFETADGLTLNGWWLSGTSTGRTILYFQGNRQWPSEYRRRLTTFTRLGVNALIFDYRGFGQSPGHIREEEDIYRDGLAAWDYLCRRRAVAPEHIILWGRSLGGAVAVEVARRRTIGGLILESTFNSMADMGDHQYGWLPTRRLLRFQFDSGAKIAQVTAPLIVIHSPEDRYIPFTQAEKLFRQASHPKALLKTSGSHIDLFDHCEAEMHTFQALWRRLTDSQPDTL